MISKKAPPSSIKDPELSRIVQHLYKIHNELIDAVNQKASLSTPPHSEGKEGDIRIVKNGDGDYGITVKTKDGWVESGKQIFQMKEKT